MILIPFILIYLIYMVIFFLTLKSTPNSSKNEIRISLIVAAKNEEENISALINALQRQKYSTENFEVIIVDDMSCDLTYTLGLSLTAGNTNMRIIKAENKKYDGKRGALQIGIDNSNYEYLLFTDTDCRPNEEFLISYANKFQEGKDLVFGVAPIRQNNSVLNKIICYDNLWVHILTFSMANIGLPYSAAGRSLGIKKESFNYIKGYKKTLETISGDDDLLLREANKNGLCHAIIINKNSFVYSEGKKTFKEFISQKSRHTTTSQYYPKKIKFVIGTWHISNLLMFISPIFIGVFPEILFLFFIKIIFELIIVKFLMKLFGYQFSSIEIIGLSLYHQLILIVFFIGSKFRKEKW